MKILCSLSGLEFSCDYFPGEFHSRETHHPVFNIPQKKLLSYLGKWAAGQLTTTDSYLLFLAVLHSSEQVEFRVPVIRTSKTDAIIAQNMEYLFRTIIKLNTVTNPSVVFPKYAITTETRTLDNVHYWIENWSRAYQDFLDGYTSAHDSAKLIQREKALERMIKNPHKSISEYSSQLAEWAATAGEFPSFLTPSPWATNLSIPLAEIWKQIIIRCSKAEQLYSIRREDLEELITHCEDHIPPGSIFSHSLFKVLRVALEKQKNFLGLGDMDLTSHYTLLTPSDTVEYANLKAAADSAPSELPKPEQYPTKFAYIKAKLRWDTAQKLKKAAEVSGERREN